MEIISISSSISWERNVRSIDVVKTYQYDDGTTIKRVIQIEEAFPLYTAQGSMESAQSNGNALDEMV
jgi:hypothetical protein